MWRLCCTLLQHAMDECSDTRRFDITFQRFEEDVEEHRVFRGVLQLGREQLVRNTWKCGAWSMEHGAWSMEHGAWSMAHGAWNMNTRTHHIRLTCRHPSHACACALPFHTTLDSTVQTTPIVMTTPETAASAIVHSC